MFLSWNFLTILPIKLSVSLIYGLFRYWLACDQQSEINLGCFSLTGVTTDVSGEAFAGIENFWSFSSNDSIFTL